MNNRVWWVAALQGVFWLIAMTLVTRWVTRSRATPPGEDPNLLRYPKPVLVIGATGTVLFTAAAILCFLTSPASPFLIALTVLPFVAGSSARPASAMS